jgi:hypothetical protein
MREAGKIGLATAGYYGHDVRKNLAIGFLSAERRA